MYKLIPVCSIVFSFVVFVVPLWFNNWHSLGVLGVLGG